MIAGMYEQDLAAYIIFGIFLNFLFSILFGIYLTKNIGMETMAKKMGKKDQSLWIKLSLFIPYAKMLITLYRVAILQFFFLNKGYTHEEFWVYMTNDEH
ncbi:MAG: hypothetical protein GXO11_08505 [Epsilonproteobacteria bacterium]|nr:hypothetical protein [Campylobacterota bacterium]